MTSKQAPCEPGRRFGFLTALKEADRRGSARLWHCRCDCGDERIVYQSNLTGGHTKSCGCGLATSSHQQSQSREYRAWINMISRCENPNTPGWENYGGRGISVCARWRASYAVFREDMGKRPGRGYSVDRIDNNGNYEPGNCRWATRETQMRNFRGNRIVEIDGKQMTLVEAVSERGLKYNTVLHRILRGQPIEEALR